MSKNNSSPSVGRRIRAARKAASLTLEELGKQIGVSNQALSAIERGIANPSKQTLVSLAKLFKDDLDQPWLRRYVVESRQPDSRETIASAELLWGMTIEEFWERRKAAELPRPVLIATETAVNVPVHYQISNGDTLSPADEKMYVTALRSMVPSLINARAVLVLDEPIRNAFIGPGDALILTECPQNVTGRIVLALLDNGVMIGRVSSKGSKITLSPLDLNCDSVTVSRRAVEFIGEVTGLVRSLG